MTDNVSKKRRSEIMGKVRSQDSKMEVKFRKALWRTGFRYSKNAKDYFGKPDLVLKKYKTVIFIDSCFWHGCKKHCRVPADNRKYWVDKIERNKKRDKQVNQHYRKKSWNILRVWEHEIQKDFESSISKIIESLR